MKKLLLSLCLLSPWVQAATQQTVADYFEHIKHDPEQLYLFLAEMPKGGDLHNHLAGATYAEAMIDYGQKDGLCVGIDGALRPQTHCKQGLSQVEHHPDEFNQLVNQWSLRYFVPTNHQSTQAHFFHSFGEFSPIISQHISQAMAEVVQRAADQHEAYLELLISPFDIGMMAPTLALAHQVKWDNDFAKLRQALLAKGMAHVAQQVNHRLQAATASMRQSLHCDKANAASGCQVVLRFQYLALREMQALEVFAQLLSGFEAAQQGTQIVGINLVQAEDGPIAMRHYDLHMRMLKYLHSAYPKVHISLHAGELAPDDVPPEALRYHIRHAIEIGQAERIGHGTAMVYEANAKQLMREMAQKAILVEVNLTSNDKLLGIKDTNHPFPLLLKYHVPVALSTDDEGILRTDLTREFHRAVLCYDLSYADLKTLVRNSLNYSFLPGAKLWQDSYYQQLAAPCNQDMPGSNKPSAACQAWLKQNEKASLQWQLERDFKRFEQTLDES